MNINPGYKKVYKIDNDFKLIVDVLLFMFGTIFILNSLTEKEYATMGITMFVLMVIYYSLIFVRTIKTDKHYITNDEKFIFKDIFTACYVELNIKDIKRIEYKPDYKNLYIEDFSGNKYRSYIKEILFDELKLELW